MGRGPGGRFNPDGVVTTRQVHRSLVFALGLRRPPPRSTTSRRPTGTRSTPRSSSAPPCWGCGSASASTTRSTRRRTSGRPPGRGASRRRGRSSGPPPSRPGSSLPRGSVRRHGAADDGAGLPHVDWGAYVGYPYIWAGEWGFDTPSPPAREPARPGLRLLGGSPGGRSVAIRTHGAFPAASLRRLVPAAADVVGDVEDDEDTPPLRDLRPGDLMFFDEPSGRDRRPRRRVRRQWMVPGLVEQRGRA